MAGVLGDRWRWLGRPAFLAAVGVLALNDHVFKHRVPGWWTGKLSDVAGVAVVGTLAAVVLGVRRGLVATAASFCVLKAVPGVADAAAPVLGGVTALAVARRPRRRPARVPWWGPGPAPPAPWWTPGRPPPPPPPPAEGASATSDDWPPPG